MAVAKQRINSLLFRLQKGMDKIIVEATTPPKCHKIRVQVFGDTELG
jgi:hypothetical protein